MSKLNVEATILALCAAAVIQPIYDVAQAEDPLPEDNAEPGALANLGWSLDDVNARIAPLDDATRRHADLPRKELGTVYFVTDTTVERARQRGLNDLADQLDHLQGLVMFAAPDPRMYQIAAGRYERKPGSTDFESNMAAPWPNTRVFPRGVKDEDVLPAVEWRLATNAGTNPDQEFPGSKG